ncbi:MAG: imidazole glycerol phosphate synthase subunit HisH [Methanobacteriaceae archaeon]|nr:imidazole glycerol phosphate synthase subunit HisH [Methanobacteriaceae archaeon]
MITIIDYGSGNLKSINNGFSRIGAKVRISQDKKELKEADALILPGVGAFGTAMDHLRYYEDLIHDHIDDGKPFLGICLGLQVLFTSSQESPGVKGLDVFPGEVVRFPPVIREKGLKIPHMGWNNLQIKQTCPILEGVSEDFMYFVHSFYVKPRDESIVAASVDYGLEVPSVVFKDNVFATQFHPEKSGEIGLLILQNFLKLVDL